jgi:hypothetical protein
LGEDLKLGFNLLLWTMHVTDEHWPIIEDTERGEWWTLLGLNQ